MRNGMAVLGLLSLAAAGLATAADVVKVDPGLAAYQAASGVSGSVSSIGSDTLNNLNTLWAEKFNTFYPNVKIQIEGKGSSTAPPALIAGTSQLGPMSRAMKGTEIDAFEKKYGWKPTQVRVAVDALGVFVHKDNPIKSLTLQQVDAIFSKTVRRGGKVAKTWGDVGLGGEWANKPLSLYGRNSVSGTYGFFKEHALKNGDYKDEVKEQPGSASVVLSVAEDRYAIGYSGIGYNVSSVRALPLADETAGGEVFEPSAENAYAGSYPLARFLFIYVNRGPGKPLDPVTREYLKLVLSKEGQEVVLKDGFFPLPGSVAAEERGKVE